MPHGSWLLGVKINIGKTLVGEWYLEEDHRRNVYSAAKSFTVCAVGFALQENLLSLDEKLTDAFAEDLPSTISENLSCATVKDLLTMHLGQKRSYLRDAERPLLESDNWVRLSLRFRFFTALVPNLFIIMLVRIWRVSGTKTRKM